MAEKKMCDMSDNLQSSEIPLKKRKDSRLSNCSSASWRIENSQTGNPLKKRFFRSLLSCDEDKSSSRTSVKRKTYFSAANEEENIFTSDPNSALSENRIPLEENSIINLSSANKDLYFSHRDKKMILKPSKNDLDVLKSGFERDVTVNKEDKLLQLNNLDSPYGIFAGIKDMSYNKKNAVNSSPTVTPGVQDLSCKNSSPNSSSLISDSKTFLEAMNFITSIYSGVSDSSKKLRSNENSDIKRPKTEECHLIPEADKTTLKHKEECDWSNNTQSVLVHNVNGNSEKSRLISGSSPVLSQDKVFPSPLLSNYVDYFCNSEINTTPSQSSPQKAESLFPQESHSQLSGDLEQSILSLQQSADNAVSFNKDDTYNYLSCSNLSNAEHEFTSEVKKEDKYFGRPSSSLDNFYIQSNSSKSPLDFSLLLKSDVPQHEEVSEVRGENEKHNITESFSQENADHLHLRSLKSSMYFSKEKSVPPLDATSEIPSNMAASSSHVNTDYIHSRTLKSPLFLSLLLKSNENIVPPQHENHCDVGASSSQENPCYKPSTLDIRFFKCIDNIRNNGDSDFSPMSCLKDKKDNKFYTTIESSDKQLFKNHLSQFNIAKVKEESVTEENMLPSNQSEFEQNLLSESNKESKKNIKYFPSYSFSKREKERKDDNELENTLIDVCKEQLRNYASVTESIPNQKTSEGNKYGRESENKSEYLSASSIFTKGKKEDKLKNALIEVCEEELKNSFVASSPSYAKRCDPVNELQGKISPGSSYKQEDCVIDLCSNNDKRTNDDGNDDDVKVIKVLNNQNSDILIENCMRPVFSTTQLDSFESVFQCRPSTSKCHSKFHSPTLPLDMTTPQMVRNKSVLELLPSSSHTASGSQQAHQNERKEKNYPWDPVLLNSNDDYLSISSPDSVINISSSSPSPSSSPHQHSNERTIEDEIFGSLIRAMDLNQRKRPSILKTGKKSKEIPVLTLPGDDSSDEDKDLRCKKSKLSKKGRKGESSSRDTAKVNEMRPELECAICLESMSSKRGTSATTCGHVYCTPCIDEVIEKKGECPTCRKPLDSTQVHKLFLFA